MKDVFILWHQNAKTEDNKLLGVFESEVKARNAIDATSDLPGFKDSPDGFLVDRYQLDKVHWAEGFGI